MGKVHVPLRRSWWLVIVLVASGGCGGKLPPQGDPEMARAALREALDAWQAEQPADSLLRRQPPIYFNDPMRRTSVQLLGYQLAEQYEFHGQSVRLTAVLSLKLEDGTTREKKAAYVIDTSPATVIVPD